MTVHRKPEWLRKKIFPVEHKEMRQLLESFRLNTVCEQALCPNISECFASGQATFLILGKNCTRQCTFCNVEKSTPLPVDDEEPFRLAEAISRLKLSHVVITSPTRDDLQDGGALIYADTVAAIRRASPDTRIELLIPDFQGSLSCLSTVIKSDPDIIAHNLETVRRLYEIRRGSDYSRSLELLRSCAQIAPHIKSKSGIMLGMGEREEEVLELLGDLIKAGCSYLSIGQYLSPGSKHYPVYEYIRPEQFESLRIKALEMGFSYVESGPYIRSSYHAGAYN